MASTSNFTDSKRLYKTGETKGSKENKNGVCGGASAAKEPGHLEVRTSSSQVTRMYFFPLK